MLLSLPPLLPGGMPLLGHLPAFYRDRMQVLRRGYAACGPIFRLRLGPQSMVVLVGPTYNAFFFEHTDNTLAMDRAYQRAMIHGALPPDARKTVSIVLP